MRLVLWRSFGRRGVDGQDMSSGLLYFCSRIEGGEFARVQEAES